MSESNFILLEPGSCSSSPCGPYYLQPLDTGGSLDISSPVGIRISTEISGRYFWVEHRTKKGNGNAAYICSASYSLSYGGGGLLRKTVPPD